MNPASFLRRLVLLKEGEARPLFWSGAYYFCILFGYYLLRPYRDEMGVRGDLDKLPWLWTATSLAMVAAAPVFAFVASRLPRRMFIPLTYLFIASNLLVFYGLFLTMDAKTHLGLGYTFYVWLSVANLFMTSLFWGFMADVFRPEQGKRLFGAIGVGGTLGAIGGSSIPAMLVKGVDVGPIALKVAPVNLLPLSVVFLVLAVVCVRRLMVHFGVAGTGVAAHPAKQSGAEPGRGILTGLTRIAQSPYLMAMALYMLLFTVTGAFLSMEQNRIVKDAFATPADRVAFFGRVDLAVNLLSFCTQLFFTGRILTRLGLLAGLLLLPVVTGTGFAILAVMGTPAVVGAVMVARRGLHYAVDRPTREVLYTILGPEEKYKSKSLIDTLVYRGGDVLGVWADLFLSKAGVAVAAPAIGLAALWGGTGAVLARMNKRLAAKALEAERSSASGVRPTGAPPPPRTSA